MEQQHQENSPQPQNISSQSAPSGNSPGRRPLVPVLFALVIVFFFFNFFTISCGGQRIGKVTGINLVTGTSLESKDMFSDRETRGGEVPPSGWAIVALAAAIAGLGVFLFKVKRQAQIGTASGAVGFVSLIILQFVIKDAIEDKAEVGLLKADFQFAYWAALLLMGLAGLMSYLSLPKKNAVSMTTAVPPSTPELASTAENPAPTVTTSIPPPQGSQPFLGKSSGKSRKALLIALASVIVLFCIYYFSLPHDPVKDAKKAFTEFCDCSSQHNADMIAKNKEFIKTFETSGFKTRKEAVEKIDELQLESHEQNALCYEAAQQQYNKLRKRYIGRTGKLGQFDDAYKAMEGQCIPENGNLWNETYSAVWDLIKTIDEPIPGIEQIKSDLLGKKIPGWSFDALSEFDRAIVTDTARHPEYVECTIDLLLKGDQPDDSHEARIVLDYGQNVEGWKLNSVKEVYITYTNTAPVNEWKKITPLEGCSYSILDQGNRYWVKDGFGGDKYKGGPDGEAFHLTGGTVYIMSRENRPVELVFKYSPKE